MARIRTIKPEFFTSPDIAALDFPARQLFQAMWCYADDFGIGETNLYGLLGFAFPDSDGFTAEDLRGFCAALAAQNLAEFYTVRGRHFYVIQTWDSHQKTERRSTRRKNPTPEDPEATPDMRILCCADSAPNLRRTSGANPPQEQGKGNRGSGTGEQTTTARERARAPRESSSTFADGTPIPPEPPHDSDEHVVVAEIVPTEIGTAATPRTTSPGNAAKTTVRTILGGAGYPDSTIQQLATQVSKLSGKHEPELIAEALREWDRRPNVKPSFLGSVLGDVVKARRARPDQPKSKLRALAELANEERSRENDHQPNRKELA
ncbi:hypothetical protein SAMN04488550_4162 [Gordonia malaquae]|uniref:DnaD domain-containing protein n=1 Tax=Gordonia malaquae NBRC 108250 TaxID=1223542 RepID=M3UNI4_GORML|nr:hypothetical protein [Gordonia malaquae]GAC81680.1 hypothetical protein GM1_041_00510 [Gordonia malaquae NBRC 108250]SEE25927.1 hypothetical protein SAMN04488550_4162 [Gordonia malaquae]